MPDTRHTNIRHLFYYPLNDIPFSNHFLRLIKIIFRSCIFLPNPAGDSGSNRPLILVESGHLFWFIPAAFSAKSEYSKSVAALDNLERNDHDVSSQYERRTKWVVRGWPCGRYETFYG